MPAASPSRPQATTRSAWALLVVSAILAVLQMADISAWSRAFDRGHSQAERVALYLEGLPAFLSHAGTLRLTLLAALCGALGAACAVPAAVRGRRPLTILGWVAFTVNALFLAWNLFSLM